MINNHQKIDVAAIKREIRVLSYALGARTSTPSESDISSVKLARPNLVMVNQDYRPLEAINSGGWNLGAVSLRYTKLCALRAHMRGKLHFSASTNLHDAVWSHGIYSLLTGVVEHHSGATIDPNSPMPPTREIRVIYRHLGIDKVLPLSFKRIDKLPRDQSTAREWTFGPITLAAQAEWVKTLAEEFTVRGDLAA